MRILILGGTGFLGPHQVRYALARGHTVTVFNRGTHSSDLPKSVEQLVGDRATGKLQALEKRQWDVCIDNPTTLPSWVRDAGRVLHGRVSHYIFVYVPGREAGDESAPVYGYDGPDAMAETLDTLHASQGALYGPLKVRSEREALEQFRNAATIIRPGLIVGPGDESDRFTYWPVRLHRGGEVLAPGDGRDPVQIIDARDLAEWMIRMAETRSLGTFNATGPATELHMGTMLKEIAGVLHADAKLTWVPADFLSTEKVEPWSDMPAWLPRSGEVAGIARQRIAKALAKGLTFRPLNQTAAQTLDWFRQQPPERQAHLKAGLGADREREVLAHWHARLK